MRSLITILTDAYLAGTPVDREIRRLADLIRPGYPVLAEILTDPASSEPMRDRAVGHALRALKSTVTALVA